LADGGRRIKRSAQQLAKKHGFPLVKIGLVTFIDPVIAAERLREAQLAERAPRPRGRPRQYRGGSSAADAPAPLVAAPHTK